MADVVEHKMEEMMNELKLLEKSNIFTAEDLGVITKKKRDFETRLQRSRKAKSDILDYIQYEMDLLKLVKFKRGELGIAAKKTSLDYSIAAKINNLFNQAVKRYPHDAKIWVTYLKFCRRVKFYTCASRACETMLHYHSDKPSLYKIAALFEFENENIEKARSHLLTGIHQHASVPTLYIESIKLELDYIAKEAKKSEVNKDDPILQCLLAGAIYESAILKLTNVEFVADVLKVVKKYSFTDQLQAKIYDDLLTRFPKEELTWDLVAQKDFENITTPTKDHYGKLSQTYEEAVKIVNTPLMWKIYIDRMLELKDNPRFPNAKRNAITTALCNGNNAGMLTERDYFIWKEHLQDKDEKRLYKIWKCGTEKIPDSVKLWAGRLTWHLKNSDETGAEDVFRRAIANLKNKDKNLDILWKLFIQFYDIQGDNYKAELYYEEAVKFETVGLTLKPIYLQWSYIKKGVLAGRKLYEKLAVEPPFCLQLHLTMIRIEQLAIPSCPKLVRKCYSFATQQFGNKEISIWMDYIKFEQNRGKAKFIPMIYSQAEQTLQPDLFEIFRSDYSIYMTQLGHLGISPQDIEIKQEY